MKTEIPDVAVIGAGPAGLAAASSAREYGVKDVVVIERDGEVGGILQQCIHNGFGLHYFKQDLTGPEYALRFARRAEEFGVRYKLNTMVLDIRGGKILAVNPGEGMLEVRPKSIVLAMGCREKTRDSLGIPGTRPSGIFTAGLAQRLINIEGYMPGRRVVILGSGDVGLIMARRFALEGAEVRAVVEMMSHPGGLLRNVVQCLEDFGIPLLLSHTIVNIKGGNRIKSVVIARVGEDFNPIGGTEEEIECDTLLLSAGLIPENELSEKAGVEMDPETGGPVVDEFLHTSIEGIFACGNVLHVNDLADNVSLEGEVAGRSAAQFALNKLPEREIGLRIKAGENARQIVPGKIVNGQEPVRISMRGKLPMNDSEVVFENTGLVFKRRYIRPAEMVTVQLKKDDMRKLRAVREEVISIRER